VNTTYTTEFTFTNKTAGHYLITGTVTAQGEEHPIFKDTFFTLLLNISTGDYVEPEDLTSGQKEVIMQTIIMRADRVKA